MKQIFVVLLIVVTAQTLRSQSDQSDEELRQRIDNYLSDGASKGLSGAMLVYKKGKLILNKGYGFADKESEIANTPTTATLVGDLRFVT
ncbi:MAG: CubicO group peptidase (beta-lactamase class C family) [Patiriisocius sp.]|jgi:CubicO group peptidase (beta-lactamase class C family)